MANQGSRCGDDPRNPSVLRDELERAFAGGEWVVVCWEPGCLWHRLIAWTEEEWVEAPCREGYPRYTHGICPTHLDRLMEEIAHIERLLDAQVAQTQEQS